MSRIRNEHWVDLLRCPFFRADEHKLWRFAQIWCQARAAPEQEGELAQLILWELMPQEQLNEMECGRCSRRRRRRHRYLGPLRSRRHHS